MQKFQSLCFGAALGAITIIIFNYLMEWMAYLLLSYSKPSWNSITALFQPRFLQVPISGAVLGAFTAIARYVFISGDHKRAANLCVIGGLAVGLAVVSISARDISLVFQREQFTFARRRPREQKLRQNSLRNSKAFQHFRERTAIQIHIDCKGELLPFQMVDQSPMAKSMTSNLLLWKFTYVMRSIATNTPAQFSFLLLLVGLGPASALTTAEQGAAPDRPTAPFPALASSLRSFRFRRRVSLAFACCV